MCFAGRLEVAPPSYGVLARLSHRPRQNSENHRSAEAVIAARGFSTLNLFGWIQCGLALRRFAAHPGELLLEFLQLVIR